MDKCLQKHAYHCRQCASKFGIIDFVSIIRTSIIFNFECHNLSFLGDYILSDIPAKLYDISGRNDNANINQWKVKFTILSSKIDLTPFIVANL